MGVGDPLMVRVVDEEVIVHVGGLESSSSSTGAGGVATSECGVATIVILCMNMGGDRQERMMAFIIGYTHYR